MEEIMIRPFRPNPICEFILNWLVVIKFTWLLCLIILYVLLSMLMDEYWGFCGEIFKMDYEGELVRLFDLDSLLQR